MFRFSKHPDILAFAFEWKTNENVRNDYSPAKLSRCGVPIVFIRAVRTPYLIGDPCLTPVLPLRNNNIMFSSIFISFYKSIKDVLNAENGMVEWLNHWI